MQLDTIISLACTQVIGLSPINEDEKTKIETFAKKAVDDVYNELALFTNYFNQISYIDIDYDSFTENNVERDTDGRTYYLPVCVNTKDDLIYQYYKINYVYLDDTKLPEISLNTALQTLEVGKNYSLSTALGYVVIKPYVVLVKMPQPETEVTKKILISYIPSLVSSSDDIIAQAQFKFSTTTHLSQFDKLGLQDPVYANVSNNTVLPPSFISLVEIRLIYYLTRIFPTLDTNATSKAEINYLQALNGLKESLLMEKQLKVGWTRNQYGILMSDIAKREQKELEHYVDTV